MKSKFNQIFENIIKENIQCKYLQDLKKYKICSKYSPYLNLPYIFSIENDLINEVKAKYTYKQIHSYQNSYLIYEVPTNIADYGDNILNYIDINNDIILTKTDFLNYIPKTWQYYNIFLNSNDVQLYIYKFDFENTETKTFSLVNNILKKFYTQQELGVFFINKKLHAKQFKEQNTLSSGGTMPIIFSNVLHKKVCLIYLNTNIKNHYNKITINHQLFHYMQNLLHIDLLKDIYAAPSCTNPTILNYLKQLNLSYNYYLQYFNRHEFWTYINVNLIYFFEDFFKIMKNKNKNLKQSQMIQKILSEIEIVNINEINKNKLLILIFSIMKNHEINMLKFLILIAKIYSDTLFLEVKTILLKYFE